MHKPESVMEHVTHEIIWDFEMWIKESPRRSD